MLVTEWNWDDALAVRYEEGREEGKEEGREEIARSLLAKGWSVEDIAGPTGLTVEAVKNYRLDSSVEHAACLAAAQLFSGSFWLE